MENETLVLWINNEEKVISFHKENNFISKEFNSQDEYKSFILAYGRSGYRFQ